MPTFEEFAKSFDLNQPEEYIAMLHQYQRFIDALWDAYNSKWTYCGGCHKTVRFDLAVTANERLGEDVRSVTRCPECGVAWFVRNVEVHNGVNQS